MWAWQLCGVEGKCNGKGGPTIEDIVVSNRLADSERVGVPELVTLLKEDSQLPLQDDEDPRTATFPHLEERLVRAHSDLQARAAGN